MLILDIMITLLLAGSGLYALRSCMRLKKERVLFENKILYPSNCPPEDCIDPDGFIDYIVPRMSIFAYLCLLAGVGTIVTSLLDVGTVLMAVETIAVLFVFIFISVVQNRSAKTFW